jgi:hypothetical protein
MSEQKWYAMQMPRAGELYTNGGRVIIHDNPRELGWLIPNVKVVSINWRNLGRPLVRLRDLPEMAGVAWPLQKSSFMEGGE